MAGKSDTSATLFAQKKLLGKAHTSNLKIDGEEVIGSNIQTSTGLIFGEEVPNSPSHTLYLPQGPTDSVQTVEYIQFVLTALTGTTYDANVSGGGSGTDSGESLQTAGPHAYKFVLPSNYQSLTSNSRAGNGVFNNSKLVHETLGKLQLIPPFYSQAAPNPYIVKIYKDNGAGNVGDEIPLLDNIDWTVDYYNGILFLQDYNSAKVPAFARAFAYIGKMADEVISSGSVTPGQQYGDLNAPYLVLETTSSLSNERVFRSGTGLTFNDEGAKGNYTISVNDSVVATLSGSKFFGEVSAPNFYASGIITSSLGFSGSLTKLSDGTSYLIAGSGVTISTGSNGSITIQSNLPDAAAYSKGYFYGSAQDASGNIDVSSVGSLVPNYSPVSDIDVYVNGQLLVAGVENDYTVPSNSTVHLNSSLKPDDVITVKLLTTAPSNGSISATVSNSSVITGIAISATTTDPAINTRSINQVSYRTIGDKIKLAYKLGWAAGTAGSGDYLISLPGGVTFNTQSGYNPTYTGVLWNPSVNAMAPYMIPAIGGVIQSDSWSQRAYVLPYSNTKFRLVLDNDDTEKSLSSWKDTWYSLANEGMLQLEFEIWT